MVHGEHSPVFGILFFEDSSSMLCSDVDFLCDLGQHTQLLKGIETGLGNTYCLVKYINVWASLKNHEVPVWLC